MAIELESFFRDLRAIWLDLRGSEKLAILSSVTLILSSLLPWVSQPERPTQIGLDGIGILHLFLAFFVVWLVLRLPRLRRTLVGETPVGTDLLEFRSLRYSLYFVLAGAMAILTSIGLLVHFGQIAEELGRPVDVRFGFYVALVASLGLSLAGFLEFSRRRE